MSVANGASIANGGEKIDGGRPINRAITPGGHALDNTQPAFPVYHRKFANPAPLGLFAFATTTFLLSMINVSTRNVTAPNIVIGVAIAYGGTAQFLAGMWEFAAGNTFGAVAFSSYGAFWWSFAITLIPWFNSASAYTGEETGTFANAFGLYLVCWFTLTFMLLLASLRSSVGLVAVFVFLSITFILLFAAEFTGKAAVGKAGGAFGIITAWLAYYVGLAGMLSPDTSYFVLPVVSLAPSTA